VCSDKRTLYSGIYCCPYDNRPDIASKHSRLIKVEREQKIIVFSWRAINSSIIVIMSSRATTFLTIAGIESTNFCGVRGGVFSICPGERPGPESHRQWDSTDAGNYITNKPEMTRRTKRAVRRLSMRPSQGNPIGCFANARALLVSTASPRAWKMIEHAAIVIPRMQKNEKNSSAIESSKFPNVIP